MKRCGLRQVHYFLDAVGKEVGFSLVRESPVASWTRVAWMTHTGAEGR
jgi:hypothetical protein